CRGRKSEGLTKSQSRGVLSGSAFFGSGAQDLGDGFDRFSPIGRLGRVSLGSERTHGVLCRAAVAEEARAGLARHADGLMPFYGIDMPGDHRSLLVSTAT